MKIKNRLLGLISISTFFASGMVGFAQAEPLGLFDGRGDVGAPAITGSASYDPAQKTYTLTGGGINMWGASDQFHFLWKKMKGDFVLRARFDLAAPGAVEHRKLGWMVRSSLDANSAFVDGVAENGNGPPALQYRRAAGGRCATIALPIRTASIIQLERRGTNYIFTASLSGDSFVSTNCAAVSLPDDVYAGLCICGHGPGLKGEVVFRDVQLTESPK